jgi:hypothetical protein
MHVINYHVINLSCNQFIFRRSIIVQQKEESRVYPSRRRLVSQSKQEEYVQANSHDAVRLVNGLLILGVQINFLLSREVQNLFLKIQGRFSLMRQSSSFFNEAARGTGNIFESMTNH